ncbi:hypothetical protein [Furfurilactobacillus siliginis]|uniref:Uncharacterized protein n=1 Tax=Furfurilactobacillus siliginis TaxID=348151 RepID=A0A0R2L663_9LACO|nr:hypothetical protein [Furfurilactobacillus siliginis]KRN96832.1 hypothetical protein IV55_GL000699 [Furfurilactobacillus siliginis]GEK28497.1 hypothetical protein LSI01_08080 [Furfurilactobacillus siliginis]
MKIMTVGVTDEQYDWMIKFIESESPEEGYDLDAPSVFAGLIEDAHFDEFKSDSNVVN